MEEIPANVEEVELTPARTSDSDSVDDEEQLLIRSRI